MNANDFMNSKEYTGGIVQLWVHEIAELMEEYAATKSEWVSVEDRLPEEGIKVLVFAPDRDIIGSKLLGSYFYDSKEWTVYCFRDTIRTLVTHWQPLPNPPKVK